MDLDSDKVNRWLTLVANIGVVIGLVVLIVELNQNTTLARLDLQDSRRSAFLQGEFAIYGDRLSEVWARSILNPAELSASDIRILDAYLVNVLNRSNSVYDLEVDGLVSAGTTISHLRSNLPFDFGNHFAQKWWQYEKEFWSGEFADMVDAVIAELEPTRNSSRIKSLLSDAQRFPVTPIDKQ